MKKSPPKSRTIEIDYLARVEGEGALFLKTKNNKIETLNFKIFEPPRFFEAFLRGRDYTEAPDITARICGICPVAYQMSSVHALENAFEVKIDPMVRLMRRLLYCGEWIESHTLHVYMLHAPDFLGFEDAVQMSQKHKGVLEKGLALKKVGNRIGQILGGREVHPINVRVGGFYKLPDREALEELREELLRARDLAIETAKWVSKFDIPEFSHDYIFVSLKHSDEYPFNEGRVVSNQGLDISVQGYEKTFKEEHVKHSNALHAFINETDHYFVGPLARLNNNFSLLSPVVKQVAQDIKVKMPLLNPFRSIIARSLEILYACDEALRVLSIYEEPKASYSTVIVKAGEGFGATEAPRGLLYHRYKLDNAGKIIDCKIIPPTSQNQGMIEADLRKYLPEHLKLSDEKLKLKCEQAIRNYDPCISCATHFLKFERVCED